MKVGISGASGHLGKAVLEEIGTRSAGTELVAISRTPYSKGINVENRLGDYNRPETLVSAYAGLDRLLIIPSADLRKGVRGVQYIAAIDAAVAAGVKHIVLLSALGTRKQEEPANGASYWVAEQHLIKTAPTWTIVRMSYYAEAFAHEAQMLAGTGLLTGLSDSRISYVSRDDVAAAVAGVLIGKGHTGAIYSLTGPKSLTSTERAEAATRFTGKQFGFVVLTEEQLRGNMIRAGLPEDVVNVLASIQAAFAEGVFDVVTGHVEQLSGRAPRPLQQVLDTLLNNA
ncbi:NAD(P)H-binding protein [Pseudomonas chlororaphis]|uniref:NAD(P)H-binding protein n=1 Tax=Pseudomonas chlororaphis TaxID=587753 RepID=UPI001926DE81|nr:NAD(P)H-binding protein [Pseudomonas chlororaphis]QQX56530.1 NAD(P)H-binding protein [Pseudomonas chlororaphis subsp. aurantiaca]